MHYCDINPNEDIKEENLFIGSKYNDSPFQIIQRSLPFLRNLAVYLCIWLLCPSRSSSSLFGSFLILDHSRICQHLAKSLNDKKEVTLMQGDKQSLAGPPICLYSRFIIWAFVSPELRFLLILSYFQRLFHSPKQLKVMQLCFIPACCLPAVLTGGFFTSVVPLTQALVEPSSP